MKTRKLIYRSLWYYRRSALSILAGVTVATAVLTGALATGDSVRDSLRRITDQRLGKTRWVIRSANRFFTAGLGERMAAQLNLPVAPVIVAQGIVSSPATGRRLPAVQVVGADSALAAFHEHPVILPDAGEAVVNRELAASLGLSPGDVLLVRLTETGNLPQNAPFVAEEPQPVVLRLTLKAVATDDGIGRFSLNNDQKSQRTLFVSLGELSERLQMPDMANALLIPEEKQNPLSAGQLDSLTAICWAPADAGLKVSWLKEDNGWQVTTDRLFFDDRIDDVFRELTPGVPMMTYLANSLLTRDHSTPYSFVTAADSLITGVSIRRGEIVLTDWLANDLNARPGDSVYLEYFVMGMYRNLSEESRGFRVKSVIPLEEIPSGEEMMPDFPGMSDAGSCRTWETGAPVDLKRIRDKDEDFWNIYRGTPKAFISLEEGQEMWENPYGTVTAYRFATDTLPELLTGEKSGLHTDPDLTPDLHERLLAGMEPGWFGFQAIPAWELGQRAATHSTDFGGLFLSLSFFLIAAALLLTALLTGLHIRKRIPEAALMASAGFQKKTIFRILYWELMVILLAGAVLGVLAGIGYNQLVLKALNTIWQDAVRTSVLTASVHGTTLVTGALAGLILSSLTVWITLRRQLNRPLTEAIRQTDRLEHNLVAGTEEHKPASWFREVVRIRNSGRVNGWIAGISVVLAVITIAWLPRTPAGMTTSAMIAGTLVLIAGMFAVMFAFSWKSGGYRTPGITGLGLRNAALHRSGSLSAILLLALGIFILVITGANRRTFSGEEMKRTSGTGGFILWAETTRPLLHDLNSREGRARYGLQDEPELESAWFLQLMKLGGDDASCLNLNQVESPPLLGIPVQVPDSLQAFGFAELDPRVDPEHPWLALKKLAAEGVVPAYADQTVITWGLQKRVGDTLRYRNENGEKLAVVLIGGLKSSVFQGYLLIDDSLLKRHYPTISGSRVMLVGGDISRADTIRQTLEELLPDYGLTAETASGRLATFYSVTNIYLTVFMMLGALGLLTGTIGLGIVILRNILDRKSEYALYRALGFRKATILRIVVTEYAFILFTGVILGTLAGLTGIIPSLVSPSYTVPVGYFVIMILVILLNGLIWIWIPARQSLRHAITTVLQQEE